MLYRKADIDEIRTYFTDCELYFPPSNEIAWMLIYSAIQSMLFGIELAPSKYSEFDGLSSWDEMLVRCDIWLNAHHVKVIPQIAAYEHRGFRYEIPSHFYRN